MFDFLRSFFPLFTQIKFGSKISKKACIACDVFIFLQFFFLQIQPGNPNDFFQMGFKAPPILYAQVVLYFLPWIFGTPSGIIGGLFYLLFNIGNLIFVLKCKNDANNKKPVSHLKLLWIEFFFKIVQPLMIFTLSFRFCNLIVMFIEGKGTKNCYISLSVIIVNYLFAIFYLLIYSIFLEPISFVQESIVDVFDGKTRLLLIVAQIYFAIISQLFSFLDIIFSPLFVAFGFLFTIAIFYFRFMSMVHTSNIGCFLEISPFISFPVLLFIRLFKNLAFYYNVIIFILISVILVFAMRMIQKRIICQSSIFFSSFLPNKNDSLKSNSINISETSVSFLRVLPYVLHHQFMNNLLFIILRKVLNH